MAGTAADPGVNLVKNQGAHRIFVGQNGLDGKHDAGQFTAAGDFSQGLGRLARVRGNQKLHRILPDRGQLTFAKVHHKANTRHIQIRQFAANFLFQLGSHLLAFLSQILSRRLHLQKQLVIGLTEGLQLPVGKEDFLPLGAHFIQLAQHFLLRSAVF